MTHNRPYLGPSDRTLRGLAAVCAALFGGGLVWLQPAWAAVLLMLGVLVAPRWRISLLAPFVWGLWLAAPGDASTDDLGSVVTVTGLVHDVRCQPAAAEHGPGAGRCVVALTSARVGGRNIESKWPLRATFDGLDQLPEAGKVVTFEGQLTRWAARLNPNPFLRGAAPYLGVRGLTEPRLTGETASFLSRLSAVAHARLRFDDAAATGFYRALLLGDRSQLAATTRWALRDTGTAHLVAISGLHIALIAAALFGLLQRLCLFWPHLAQGGRPRAVAAAGALTAVVAYVVTIAPSDATQRALVFVSVALVGVILLRRIDARRALMLAACTALTLDPLAALRPSFQLSFAAAAALVFGAGALRALRAWIQAPGRIEGPWRRKMLTALVLAAAVNAIATVATTPLTLAWFGQWAPAGLLLNLIAVPIVAFVILPMGFMWLSLVCIVPAVAAGLASLPEWLAQMFLQGLQAAAQAVGPTLVAPWSVIGAVVVTGVFIAWLATLATPSPRLRPRARVPWLLVILCAANAAMAGAAGPQLGDRLRITTFDVGHGDAIVIQAPDGPTILVDTGGHHKDNAKYVQRTLEPALLQRGVTAIDLLVITHADLDHIGGALHLARRFPVGELWLPPCGLDRPHSLRLANQVVAQGGRVKVVAAGVELEDGDTAVTVIHPAADVVRSDGSCRSNHNNASIVLRVDYAGRRILLTGDIEAPSEAALVSAHAPALKADVLKVAHHGSRTSSTASFLAAVEAQIAVVSGMPGRRRRPPHDDVLDRIAGLGAEVWVTGLCGAVTVTIDALGRLRTTGQRSCQVRTRTPVRLSRAKASP